MKVRTSFAPQLQASKKAASNPGLNYALMTVECRDNTTTVIAVVFNENDHIIEVFIRYEYEPACRVELIYG